MSDLARAIAAESDRLGLDIPPDSIQRLDAYAGRLWLLNERINLPRNHKGEEVVLRDVGDTAA
ncbi:MAG: hypothetical protein ACKOBP_00705, partial [Planctomycetia bacterium]